MIQYMRTAGDDFFFLLFFAFISSSLLRFPLSFSRIVLNSDFVMCWLFDIISVTIQRMNTVHHIQSDSSERTNENPVFETKTKSHLKAVVNVCVILAVLGPLSGVECCSPVATIHGSIVFGMLYFVSLKAIYTLFCFFFFFFNSCFVLGGSSS